MELIGNTSNNPQLSSTAAKLLSMTGAKLARTDEAKTLADNPFSEYYEYKDNYEDIVKQGVNKIYQTNGYQQNTINYPNYLQQMPVQNYPMQQQVAFQNAQTQMPMMQYPQQFEYDNSYMQQNNTKVDISKYTGKKKKKQEEKIPENLSQLQLLNKANEPIIARLEGLLEIMGLIFQELQETNELLKLGFGVGEAIDADYDDEQTDAEIKSALAELNAAGDYIDKLDSQNKTFEEEEAELVKLSESMTPPPSPDVVEE